jgi:hypothetical protein
MNHEMKVEWLPAEDIIPYSKNPRKISDSAIELVALSIDTYGWRQPIVVDSDRVIVIGHVRWRAAQKRGLERVPVHIAEGLTPAQIRGLRIMDNRCHEETGWDLELLSPEILELKALDFDLRCTGFQPLEIDRFLSAADSDDAANASPDPPTDPVSTPGSLWCCGAHRVLCGDATNEQDVSRLLHGARPLLMSSDPPFGVQYRPEWREQAGLGKQRQVGKVANDDRVDWTAAYRLFPGDVVYLWHAGIHAAEVAMGIEAAGFEIRSQIIWAKPHFVLSRGSYHWQHEPAWFAVRKGQRSHWRGDRTQSTLWQVASLNPFGGGNREETATGHSTQKPIELMRRPILNHTERGELIYDPFLGSGTTMIAAELTGRVCYGLEIDSRYVDVIVRRWQQLTGLTATLAENGHSFDEIAA